MAEQVKIPIASAEFLGRFDLTRPSHDVAPQLTALRRHYTILSDDSLVDGLLQGFPSLFALLAEAVRPLQIAFGDRTLLHLRVKYSEDDCLLKVAVQLPANYGYDPERALTLFDKGWWLGNCHRSGGALVFDYETQDAI